MINTNKSSPSPDWAENLQDQLDSLVGSLKGFQRRPLPLNDAEVLIEGIRRDSEQILRRLLPLLRSDNSAEPRLRTWKR